MADLGAYIIPIGLLLEMTGAFMMATPDVLAGRFFFRLPDLPVLRQGVRASELEEGRRKLLDTETLNRNDRNFEQVMEVLRKQWDGEFSAVPQAFVFDDHPGSQDPMVCVLYVADPPQTFGDVSIRTRLDGGAYDWVADQETIYEWLGDEIAASRRQTEFFRGAGAGVLALGASMQAAPYVWEILQGLHLRLSELLGLLPA
jgi:hypothetical protein